MKELIADLFAEIIVQMGIEDAGIAVEIPENSRHGDYTTNIAMLLAGRLKAPPIKIGQQIIDEIKKRQNTSEGKQLTWLEKVEVVPPGFINIWLSSGELGNQITTALKEKERYGALSVTTISEAAVSKHSSKNPVATVQSSIPPEASVSTTKKAQESAKNSHRAVKSAGKEAKKNPSASFGNSSAVIPTKAPGSADEQEKAWIPVQARNDNAKKTILVEFAHPNTHKAFHIGHLRNITTGEAMVRLLESQGNHVVRVNYQGDVGMHIAKALYALLEVAPFKDDVLTVTGVKPRVEFLGKAYAAGSKAFEEDEKAQATIKDLNALIYASAQKYAREVGRNPGTTDYLALVKNHVHPLERVYELWKETRQWSLDYFDTIYARVDTHFDRFYFESECLSGIDLAKDAVKQGVLKESEGALIFDGKAHGIDTRVFANSLGLPTYEGKELALSRMETTEFGTPDQIIHVVGPEQASFFTVTFKAEELLGFVKPGVQYHLIYGWVKLKHGKMSSRTGNVVLGEWLLEEAEKEIHTILNNNKSNYTNEEKEIIAKACAVAAVKYAFLKVGTKQEIAFDLAESVSFEGDSGPYLQYAYARCMSVVRKAPQSPAEIQSLALNSVLNAQERVIARRIAQFSLVVSESANRFAPNTLCTYLFQLAGEFNAFYAKHPILEKGNEHRVALTAATAQVLKNGLTLLGIPVIERM